MASSSSTSSQRTANRLASEKSPYLLQHAWNPVDWYPWGEEAFSCAREEGKAIFLSIGYSTCHWCHVMERESFENPEIAALMNELFVNIKVDREERPDVDRVYMSTVQALTGSGGWPLSVWLTEERKPFYAGTYFPPEPRHGRPGFPQILRRLHRFWSEEPQRVTESAEQIVEALRSQSAAGESTAQEPSALPLEAGFRHFRDTWDRRLGGFGSAPKFPRPSTFGFLVRYGLRGGEGAGDALEIVVDSLRKMWAGGIYDHLGGGFHRYSVDAYWRVAHFEKMLYDQAQLGISFIEAYQICGDPLFARVATEVLDYLRRDMQATGGGFRSAEDADSAPDPQRPDDKEEGAFYLWERSEVEGLLGDASEIFCETYGVSAAGNTIQDPQQEFGTRNVLYMASDAGTVAERHGIAEEEVLGSLEAGRKTLVEARAQRPRPYSDDKVISAWNGLTISAFARAYQALGRAEDLEGGRNAALFLRQHLWRAEERRLLRRFRDGEARFSAQLDDHAFLVQGLLDLYESDFDVAWLQWAEELQEVQIELFSDPEGGAFFDSAEDPSILLRTRDLYDGAEPSGNAISVLNLLRLSSMLGRAEWRDRGAEIVAAASSLLDQAPHAVPQMLVGLDLVLARPIQVIVVGAAESDSTAALLAVLRRRLMPQRVVLLADGGEGQSYLARRLAVFEELVVTEPATAYLCHDYVCELPISDPDQLAEKIALLEPAAGEGRPGVDRW